MKKEIVYIITRYNQDEHLNYLVSYLNKNYPDFKIIVASNTPNSKNKYMHLESICTFIKNKQNRGHILGYLDLINLGIKEALKDSGVNYIISSSSDVSLHPSSTYLNLVNRLTSKKNKKVLSNSWMKTKNLATEFFIIKASKAKQVFPLNIGKFVMCILPIHNLLHKNFGLGFAFVEKVFYKSFSKNEILYFKERKFVSQKIRYESLKDNLYYNSQENFKVKIKNIENFENSKKTS